MNTRKRIGWLALGALLVVGAVFLLGKGSDLDSGLSNDGQGVAGESTETGLLSALEEGRESPDLGSTQDSQVAQGGTGNPQKKTQAVVVEDPIRSGQIRVRCEGENWQGAVAMVAPSLANFMRPTEAKPAERTASLHPGSTAHHEASFFGLAPGNWSVGVRDAQGVELWAHVRLPEQPEPGAAVDFGRGASGVRGRVWDANGAPLPGVVIALDIPLLHGGDGRATTRTDASGSYEVGGILAGAGWFTATRYGTSEEDHVRLANHVLAFPEGAWAQIDIGSPQGSGRLLATFVNAAGEPLTGGTATARRGDSAERVALMIQGNGQVEFELAPGPWQMRLWGLDGPHTVEGTAEVGSNQTTEHTFTVAGARIGGFLRNAVGQVARELPGKQQVSLRESPTGYIFRSVKVGSDGSYRFDGVDPGTYFLTSWPVGSTSAVEVTVSESGLTFDADLQIP